MIQIVKNGISVMLTYIASLVLVLAVFSLPVSVSIVGIEIEGVVYAQDDGEGGCETTNTCPPPPPSGNSGTNFPPSGIGPDYDGFNDECNDYYDSIHDCPNPDADGNADEPDYYDSCIWIGYFGYC